MITDRTLLAYEQFCENYYENFSKLNSASAGRNKVKNHFRRKDLPTVSEIGKLKMKRDPEYRPLSLLDKWEIDMQIMRQLIKEEQANDRKAKNRAAHELDQSVAKKK